MTPRFPPPGPRRVEFPGFCGTIKALRLPAAHPAALRFPWHEPSTAPVPDGAVQTFRVTHPFHPLRGREFVLLTSVRRWNEERVYFEDEQGRAISLRAQWTSVFSPPPLVAIAAGRSAFRADDLLQLARLLRELRPEGTP